MGNIWGAIQDALRNALTFFHNGLDGVFGEDASWGWAIIALTIVVRVAMLPLAIKQTRSMRAMQTLQPKIKAIQKKYKVDRELLKKDPEQYKAKKLKMNEEMTALYKEEGVNPAGGCLPLLLQAPIFLALFQVLRGFDELTNATFYFFTPGSGAPEGVPEGLGATVRQAGVPGYLLIALMALTMFWSQKQMMARTAANADDTQMQQQKIMLYVMPVFLAVISLNFPMGVLLYWVTTNFWQVGQQYVILREVEHHPAPPPGKDSGPGKGKKPVEPRDNGGAGKGSSGGNSSKGGSGSAPKPKQQRSANKGSRSHLPASRRKR